MYVERPCDFGNGLAVIQKLLRNLDLVGIQFMRTPKLNAPPFGDLAASSCSLSDYGIDTAFSTLVAAPFGSDGC